VTVAVIIDEPKIGGRDGGQVAAPAFREIIEQILPELNVRPDFETDARLADNVNNNEDIPEATAPDSAGESADFQEIPAEDKQPSATEKLKIDKRTPEAKELPAKAT
ncbi:hypothetical protein HKB26_01380, partial [Vibrio parahaemolyticus]|uniref:hypothetical protein n=1 Tax=Vibrio parahaemolyticus TaxID=670 RepID=UPI00146D204F